MEIDDVLRPTLLRHLEALREAFELGHSILAYYAIGMAKHYGITVKSVTATRDIPNHSENDIGVLFESQPPRTDDEGNQLRYPCDSLGTSHNRFLNHLRALVVYLDDGDNPDDAIPWMFCNLAFRDSHHAFDGLRPFMQGLDRVNWNHEAWQSSFAPMETNADRWRKWFDSAERKLAGIDMSAPQKVMPRPDGTFPPDGFSFNSNEVRTSKPKLWRLLSHLWTCRDRTAHFSDLAVPVWDDHACEVTKDMVGSLRRDANKLFKQANIPLRVKVQPPYVSIIESND